MRRRIARAASDRERYGHACWLAREIEARMMERLDLIRLDPRFVVDAGAGSGRSAQALAGRFPRARVVAVDVVETVIAPLAPRPSPVGWLRRLVDAPRIEPVVADFRRLPLAHASVQCVWSNLALQWLPDPAPAFAEWHRVLSTGGLVLFSTLGPDTLKELSSAWAIADRGAQPRRRVHPFIDMHDLGDLLVHAGFADPVMDMETLTLTYRDADALVADLRGAGATNSRADRPRSVTGKGRWQAMRDAYARLRREDGQVPATFEIVYGHAWKPEPRAKIDADGIARFRIDDIGRQSGRNAPAGSGRNASTSVRF